MAVAYDNTSASGGLGTQSWTHTPTGTPRGVVVMVSVLTTPSDVITGVTYGGQAMSRIRYEGGTEEDQAGWVYFLGAGIPTGAQTVVATCSDGGAIVGARAVTLTGAADTEVVDWGSWNGELGTSVTDTLDPDGREAWGFVFGISNRDSAADVAPLSGWSVLDEGEALSNVVFGYVRNANTDEPFLVGWTQVTGWSGLGIAIAVTEAGAPASAAQTHHRFFADTDTEGGSPLAAEDASVEIAAETPFRLRMQITSEGPMGSKPITLQYRNPNALVPEWTTVGAP